MMAAVNKLDAALHQLDVAVTLFLAGDYLASLTLAGRFGVSQDVYAWRFVKKTRIGRSQLETGGAPFQPVRILSRN